jgi:hypothetical protein
MEEFIAFEFPYYLAKFGLEIPSGRKIIGSTGMMFEQNISACHQFI